MCSQRERNSEDDGMFCVRYTSAFIHRIYTEQGNKGVALNNRISCENTSEN